MLLDEKVAVVYGAGSIGGAVAAFIASDRARTMTAATVNVSAGALID